MRLILFSNFLLISTFLFLLSCKKGISNFSNNNDKDTSHLVIKSVDTSSWGIHATVLGYPLTLASSSREAGAISSLNWNGVEFINVYDHGRELQCASSFDGLGECFNPTEAGSQSDGTGSISTSKLLAFKASGIQLTSKTQMAFWTGVNQPYLKKGCGVFPDLHVSQNTTKLSNHTLSKRITIGYKGIPNVIEFLDTFYVAENHTSGVFEALACYLNAQFTTMWTYNMVTSTLDTLKILDRFTPSAQNLPVIFSTNDQKYSIGIYSPELPMANFPQIGYGSGIYSPPNSQTMSPSSPNTVKFNAVFRTGNTPIGNYNYRVYLIVGTLQNVTDGMKRLYLLLPHK